MFLERNGIPFKLRPNGLCNCENSACVEDHPSDTCYTCNQPYELRQTSVTYTCEATGERYPRVEIRCTCDDGDTEWRELMPGSCKRLAWRGYDNMLGGLCDICISRIPSREHSHLCGCPECKNSPGPTIILRSSLTSKSELDILQQSYIEIFGEDRIKIWRQPFTDSLHYSEEREAATLESAERMSRHYRQPMTPEEEEWTSFSEFERKSPQPGRLDMDELAICYIEVHSDHYKLKMLQQLPENMLGNKYLSHIINCRRMISWAHGFNDPQLLEKTINACNYIEYHLVGRNFIFETLADHLLNYRSPNMREFISQVAGMVWKDIDLDFVLTEIDPRSLNEQISGILLPFSDSAEPTRDLTANAARLTALHSRSEPRNIWLNFERSDDADILRCALTEDGWGARFQFNAGWIQREDEVPNEERILRSIGWAINRGNFRLDYL